MSSASLSDAERMDRHYRFQRFIYDLTRTHHLIGRKQLISKLDLHSGETVLEIGCGTAWNLVRIAEAYPKARIYGIDVSRAMLETASASIRRRGLATRIRIAQGDATNFSAAEALGVQAFDRVFFSYALSMIPGWQKALATGATHVAPGGQLHIVDFGQCEHLPATFKRALFSFLDHYTVTPRSDLEAEAHRVATHLGLSVSFSHLHRGYTDYAVLSRPPNASSHLIAESAPQLSPRGAPMSGR